jgi:hypothetical protein
VRRPIYYSPSGEPIEDVLEWAELFERRREDMSPESWWRKHTQISDEVAVSTVWMGIDHSFLGAGPPLFWETMIFGGEHDEEQWRYSSRAAALDHHEEIAAALRAGTRPQDPRAVGPVLDKRGS